MLKVILFLLVSCLSSFAATGGGGGGASPLYSSGAILWDDFSGGYNAITYRQKIFANTNYSGLYSTVFVDGSNTNYMRVANGVFDIGTAPTRGPVYLSFSNRVAGSYFNMASMSVRMTNHSSSVDGQTTIPTIIFSSSGSLVGDLLHCYVNLPYVNITRGVASETLMTVTLDNQNAYLGGHAVPFGVTVVSNTALVRLGNESWSVTHSNLHIFGNQPLVIFELNGASTDQYQVVMEDFWAGYADPLNAMMMARSQLISGTNGTLAEKIQTVAFAANSSSYTNRNMDRVLVMGPGNANPSGGRTNYLFDWGPLTPGATLTVIDDGLAVGTNIYFLPTGSRTITNTAFANGLMLINRNYGKATLRWTGKTWSIDSLVN